MERQNRLKEGSSAPHLSYKVKKLKQIKKELRNWNT